jgi:hypothetical protein
MNKSNIKEAMNINEEFMDLFASDDRKNTTEIRIRETIKISDTSNAFQQSNLMIEKPQEDEIVEDKIKTVDSIDIRIHHQEIITIRKILDIIDKLKKSTSEKKLKKKISESCKNNKNIDYPNTTK